ncbi:MAG: carboxypeptidase-like regulatory domain-containing protein, partial [bacterium]
MKYCSLWIGTVIYTVVLSGTVLNAQSAQTGSVSGFVYDKANGEALINANVFLRNTPIGSSTNVSGYYVIPKILAGEYTLVCRYIGYKSFEQTLSIVPGSQEIINITLNRQDIELEKIVVTDEAVPTIEKLFVRPLSKIDLSAKQINQIPQVAEADLLRALQLLPGVLPVSDFSSALYIRGGTPDQNLHLIDGTDVYNPEHAFGLFSTFNTDAIKKVELSKGGFGARYGGRLSAIIDVTNLDGNREEFEGTSSLSLLSARTTVQMPLGNLGSLSGSFRRTYFDKTAAKFIDDIPTYYFFDGNIKAYLAIDDD